MTRASLVALLARGLLLLSDTVTQETQVNNVANHTGTMTFHHVQVPIPDPAMMPFCQIVITLETG